MNDDLLQRVLQSPCLPSLPSVAIEVIELVQHQDVNIKRIAHTIHHDPALAGKILKTVNSSFYGQSYSVSTVTHALVVLGLNSVKTLALGFSLVGNLRQAGGDGFDHQRYWRRSLYTATAAKTLAERAGLAQQEEAFLSGLLQDMGMVAMNEVLGDDYDKLIAQAGDNHRTLSELEREKLDLTHAQVGTALAESWKLPPMLTAPIRHHETPQQADQAVQPVVRAVALGNFVAEVFMHGQSELDADVEPARNQIVRQPRNDPDPMEGANDRSSLQVFYDNAEQWFGLTREVSEPLLTQIHRQTGDMARLFDLPAGGVPNPDQILARANEALMNLTLQTQQQQTELERQNQQLSCDAHTDALTAIANRRAFDAYAAEQFAQASAQSPLSVLFMDIDYFKQFNDNHGHAIGDQVLVAVAQTLTNVVGRYGKVFRHGGEEFAVILPAIDRRMAAGVAERLRREIENQARVQNGHSEALSVTLSIGVACYDGQTFDKVDQLIKASDKGVYAAKAGGRNCVRVFTANPQSKAAAA